MINLDQMEREARARLARALSCNVSHHLYAMAKCRLPSDVVHVRRWPGVPQFATYQPIEARVTHKIGGRYGARLEMIVAIDGPTHKEVICHNVHNFERLGVPGVWLLNEIRMGMTIAHCFFEEVTP